MSLKRIIATQPAEPLWQRVPTRTDAGELAADFMMIIKGLRSTESYAQNAIFDTLYTILESYEPVILLAEINLKLNLLWVSHKPRPGLGSEIAALIHHYIPEARLISQRFA